MRRRNHLLHKRAELLAHIQNTNSQYSLDESFGAISRPYQRRGKDIIGVFDEDGREGNREYFQVVRNLFRAALLAG